MAHFVDQFRFKFDKEQQIVFFSLCITEQRTIEHTVPVFDFYMMVQSYRATQDYSSDVLKMKIRTNEVLLTIRVSHMTRRSYNFYLSDFSKLIGQFRQVVNEEEIDQSVEHDLFNLEHSESSQSGVSLESLTGESSLTELQNKVQYLEHSLKKVHQKLDSILEKLESSSNQSSGGGVVENHNQFDNSDMPMFIPSSVNTEFEGKVETKTAKATDDSVQSASSMLKKLKKGKKK